MSKYYFLGDTFIIEDFQHAKTFANFLPAIAGCDGKPLWAFYANVGQAMGGFGVTSKDTPITPFDSAQSAYQNIPIKSFRTFIKVKNKHYMPFFGANKDVNRIMKVDRSKVSIEEQAKEYTYSITYSTVSHKNYAGLIRKVTLTNNSNKTRRFDVVDGLPIFFPNGLSNYCYKELVSLMAAYCVVTNLNKKAPFVKFKTSTADNPIVSESITGNGFVSIDQYDKKLNVIVDPYCVFNSDSSWLSAHNFINCSYKDFVNMPQQTENKLPCAFSTFSRVLKSGESYSFISLYGMFDTFDIFNSNIKSLKYSELLDDIAETEKLIDSIISPVKVKTGNRLFDLYSEQSFFDNGLRGGFPILLNDNKDGKVYYVYGRKHGDMERDYNSFNIPSRYYSSGPGNFRDVNQNRRNDLYFFPFVKDFNIKLFFSLIQADGQNPLNVQPPLFHMDENQKQIPEYVKPSLREKISSQLSEFAPSTIYTLLKDNEKQLTISPDELFSKILENSSMTYEANFAEGYWVDHWTYNVDLLENYVSIYPDKVKELLLDNSYRYFYSPVYVEPRSEKYCLTKDKKIRQYGAIDLKKLAKKCKDMHFDINKTSWLKDKEGKVINVNLASKIFNLILVKFSTLDNQQLGIEMECEKPGWNDAMNGLPGILGSSLNETIELLRLVNFALEYFPVIKDEDILVLSEQKEFFEKISSALNTFVEENYNSRMAYYEKATSSREEFRKSLADCSNGKLETISVKSMTDFLLKVKDLLTDSIKRAKKVGEGIIPTYLYYDVVKYEKLKHKTHLGFDAVDIKEYKLHTLPLFLEGSARLLKLGKEFASEEEYQKIKESNLYDKKLHIYKTCADLEDATFEIGRIHAFTKGWLERECNFLHMSYKYLLGLLKAGLYKEYYEELKTNFVAYMDPNVYGRSPLENSSFIVPTCNPDEKLHGQGFFARLTGANAEVMNMLNIMFVGEKVFTVENEKLTLNLTPKLKGEMFNEDNIASYKLFDKTELVYHNENRLDTYDENIVLTYKVDGKTYDKIQGELAEDIRNKKVERIDIFIGK